MNTTPVCPTCQLGMKPETNGVMVIEVAYNPPTPYKIWNADEWKCPKCYQRVIVGFSAKATEIFEPKNMLHCLEWGRAHLGMVRIWREWNTTPLVVNDDLFANWIEYVEKEAR